MNLKILFIENIPWLQRVWWLQVVDSRGMTLTQRKLQEKILNSQNFFTNFLNSQNSWNSLLAIGTLEPLQTSLLPTSALMKKVEAAYIGEDSDFRWIFNLESFWISSHVGQVEHSAEERVRKKREEKFFSFPRLHVACQVSW